MMYHKEVRSIVEDSVNAVMKVYPELQKERSATKTTNGKTVSRDKFAESYGDLAGMVKRVLKVGAFYNICKQHGHDLVLVSKVSATIVETVMDAWNDKNVATPSKELTAQVVYPWSLPMAERTDAVDQMLRLPGIDATETADDRKEAREKNQIKAKYAKTLYNFLHGDIEEKYDATQELAKILGGHMDRLALAAAPKAAQTVAKAG